MGAQPFQVYAEGEDLDEAFRKVRDQALYDYGHRGYTGTIAEKEECIVLDAEPITMELAEARAEKMLRDRSSPVDDKWGPAGAFRVKDYQVDGWLILGWASD